MTCEERPMSRDRNPADEICFTRAVDAFEFEGAFRCLYDSYRKRGLAPRIRHEMRVTRYHLLPTTRVFVARRGKEIVGTLSLVEDGPLGIPMRVVFARQIAELTRSHVHIGEASCFAVRGANSADLEIVHRLMGLLAQSAQRRKISRVLIAVHPRHVAFYERAAGFRVFAPSTPYPAVGGKLAVAMELNLDTLRECFPHVWRKYFGYRFPEDALAPAPVAPGHLQRIAAHWRAIYDEDADSMPFTEPGDRVAAA
jgi:hypothetical protein